MPTFTYKAIGGDGQPVSGSLQADNQAVALRMLDEQQLFPVSVEEGGGAAESVLLAGRKRKLKLRHQTIFYSQLSDLLKAGVPLLRSLDVLVRQNVSAVLSETLRDVREDVSRGQTLSEAMAKHPHAFSELHVAMIRAGETGGFLDEVLARIATFAERQDELRNKLIGSMIYPCILVFAGSSVIIFLLGYVVPQLRKFLRPENLNILSYMVFGVTDFLRVWYPAIIVGGVTLLVAGYMYVQTEKGKLAIARAQLKAPLIGRIYCMVAICRFCRILGTMLQNGVPILQSLDISKESAGNRVLAQEIGAAAENVQRGESLSKPLGASGLFPPDVIDMMAVAEESNNLDSVLVHIAETNEARTARTIDIAVRLLEPILLVIMAGVVLVIALALLLPILTMASRGIS